MHTGKVYKLKLEKGSIRKKTCKKRIHINFIINPLRPLLSFSQQDRNHSIGGSNPRMH
jgi:hypothetical protein